MDHYSKITEGIELRTIKRRSTEGPFKPDHSTRHLVTDYFTSIQEIGRSSLEPSDMIVGRCARLRRKLNLLHPSIWCLLSLLGIVSGLVGFFIDLLETSLISWKRSVLDPSNFYLSLIIYLSISAVFATVAASCGKFISIEAEGSGIPEMKTVISGVPLNKALSLQTLAAKVLGVVSATGGALSIGKEGPFVHISGILVHKLCLLFPCFRHILQDPTLKNQVLAASVAAGVCATFGAPIGGVLFSIEVTATYYVVNHMWRGLFCAVWCVLVYAVLRVASITDLIYNAEYPPADFDLQVFSVGFLAIAAALIGSLFVTTVGKVTELRRTGRFGCLSHRFSYTLVVCLLCGLIRCSSSIFLFEDRYIFADMFSDNSLKAEWDEQNFFVLGSYFILAKFVITVLSLSCPIPCGVFTPMFTTGAVLGRVFGEALNYYLGTARVGLYSLLGAACLTASVTHTLSVSVIIFELTGQIQYMLYMLFAVLISYGTARYLAPSIYDVFLRLKKLPYLPSMMKREMYLKNASDIMKRFFVSVRNRISVREAIDILKQNLDKNERLPIVDGDFLLVGEMSVRDLYKAVNKAYHSWSYYFKPESRTAMELFLNDLQLNEMHIKDRAFEEFCQEEVALGNENVDEGPIAVNRQTQLARVHFILIMLGVPQLYVVEEDRLIGIISREEFLLAK